MKLKTLKELSKTTIMIPDKSKKQPCKYPCIPLEHIELPELKQEAIKWIKHWEERFKKLKGAKAWEVKGHRPKEEGGDIVDMAICDVCSKAFKHFFNIKDDNLK